MEYTKEQIQVLTANKIIPANATAKQAEYFFEVCKRKKLDPFLKQVHMIERKENVNGQWVSSYTIQASLDGMRAIAQRNCKIMSYKRWTELKKGYDGKDQIYGCCEIQTEDRGLYSDEVPFNEYVQLKKDGSISHFWKQFPETMIKKVAEESVLRMVAPEDLSGVYGDEEMEQAQEEKQITETKQPVETKILNEHTEQPDKPKERNYTAEAEKCKTLDELKTWYLSLTKDEQKKYAALKNNVKETIEKSKPIEKATPAKDVLLIMIEGLTVENYENNHKTIEDLMDEKSKNIRQPYVDKYYTKVNDLKVQCDYVPVPF